MKDHRWVAVLIPTVLIPIMCYAYFDTGLSEQQRFYVRSAGLGVILSIKMAEWIGKRRSKGSQ